MESEKTRKTRKRKTWEQKVDQVQRRLMARGYAALDAYEFAKARVAKRDRAQKRAEAHS